jgi:elongation factor 3
MHTLTRRIRVQLMETTFVNSMDSPALAVVVPIIARGLRERSAELKKMAAMTAGNIFALVNEPRDMAPFVPIILPEVGKAVEHSHPDVRPTCYASCAPDFHSRE